MHKLMTLGTYHSISVMSSESNQRDISLRLDALPVNAAISP